MFRRLIGDFRWGVLPVPGRMMAVLFFVGLFVLPLITDNRSTLGLFTVACIFAIFAVSWDLLSGYTGQINFGHALFFGVGAYGSAGLYLHLGWQPWVTIPLGALIATAVGVISCLPALRLRPPYLSLLTMAFPVILMEVIKGLPRDWAGGLYGISGLPRVAAAPIDRYYIALIVMTVSVLIMWKLTDARSTFVRTGLIFHAIREDEVSARASGINTIRYKILAFAIGGFFAGVAGALWAHQFRGVDPGEVFALTMSFQAIIWVVFGGIVSIYGPVVGVFALYPLVERLRIAIPGYEFLIMTIVVVLVLLFMPEGIAVRIRDKIERNCPRCKLSNAAFRRECRACGASLRYVADKQNT